MSENEKAHKKAERRPGARSVIEVLRDENVDLLFGYPGGVVIPLFDELYRAPDIRLVLPRHEQGGAHAADGYARASGKVGVCIATSGPGTTNLITGIANAMMDSIPMVAITGQVKSALIGNDAFQEVDTLGITRSISKHNYLVKNAEELPQILKNAFYIARTGRPGPVVVDIPVDILNAKIISPVPKEVDLPTYYPDRIATCNPGQIKRAAEAINASMRPLFYVGGGLVNSVIPAGKDGAGLTASGLLLQVAESAKIPVTTTMMALGCFPTKHPLSLHMLGMHGTRYANKAVQDCDCLIAIGARFDDRVTSMVSAFAPKAFVVQIDMDPTSVSKNVRLIGDKKGRRQDLEEGMSYHDTHARQGIPVIADAAQALYALLPLLKPKEREDWHESLTVWKRDYALTIPPSDPDQMPDPRRIVRAVQEAAAGRDLLLCTEVGQHQMWTALYADFDRPRRWISSGGLGTMGYGLPAAMGAQLALPEALVVNMAGDGSLQMNIQEMATIKGQNLPVKIVVFDNGALGMVHQWQYLFYDRRFSHTDLSDNPDLAKIAEAYGIAAWRVTTEKELIPAMQECFAHDGPGLVNVKISPDANVSPMVKAGDPLDRFTLE